MTRSLAEESRRILDPLGVLLRLLARRAGGTDDHPAMTATQRIALIELYHGGPRRLNELADLMGTSAATASRAVDTLVGLGLAERITDPRDRRAVSVDLSREGRALAEARVVRAAEVFAPAAAALSASERNELVSLIERMTEALIPPDASTPTRGPGHQPG